MVRNINGAGSASRALRLVNEIAVAVDAELALEPAYSADSRGMPDRFELLTQRFRSRSNCDSLEAVFAAVCAGVRASDAFRAFQSDGTWRHSLLR
jgi:hypothetical protein